MSVRRAQDESIEGTPDGNTAITGIMDVPDAPTIGAVSDPGTDGYASVAFTPAVTGGTATSFAATSSPGNITATGASSPITVTGLTIGTAYTFTVTGSNSTGTGPASSSSSSFTPAAHTAFESIATVTGNGTSTSITFTSIPGTYKHLQLRISAKTEDTAGRNQSAYVIFNSDGGNNYNWHRMTSDGGSTYATSGAPDVHLTTGQFIYDNYSGYANKFGSAIVDIIDYADTSKYKTLKSFSGNHDNGVVSSIIGISSGTWRSTSAITSMTFTNSGANYWSTGTTFALYGIKG